MKKSIIIFIFILLTTGCSVESINNNINDRGVDFSFLKGMNIVALNWNYFADDKGNIYDIVKDKNKLFSNNEKYRLSQDHQNKYDRLFFNENGPVFYIKSDDEYLCSNMVELYGCKHLYNKKYSQHVNDVLINKNVVEFIDYPSNSTDSEIEYIGYIENGELYYKKFNCNYHVNIYEPSYGKCTETTEKWLDKTYGDILFAKTDYDYKKGKYYLSTILTINGLYEYKTIDTEASNKYEDVEPEYSFVKNNKYDKLKNDIIYNDLRMVLTKDYKAMTFEELMEE